MTGLQLHPLDTLLLGDGTPRPDSSAAQGDVNGLFPPPPATIAGALRAALARCNGWDGQGRWPRLLDAVLGDGPDDLGALSFEGPFLLRGGHPYFPAPRHLLGSIEQGSWHPQASLLPGPPVACDLGDAVRLPDAPGSEELRPGDGWWLTRTGLEAVLGGRLPSDGEVVPSGELWREERRVGLERNDVTRTAEEGRLYSTRHVRVQTDVALGARVTGIPDDWTLPLGELVPLGGEGRVADCRPWADDLSLDQPLSQIEASRRLLVVAVTPLDLDPDTYLGRLPLEVLGEAVVRSACLDRPQRIGGWDTLARRPLPLRSVLPPGSVLFCEVPDGRRFRNAVENVPGLPQVGARQQWGFGAVALGTWSDQSEVRE